MHIIFDFDGTLVDSFDYVIEHLNHLADEYNFHKIAPVEAQALRHLNSNELISLFRIPFYKMPRVIYKARKSLHNNITRLNPFTNIPHVLYELTKQGFHLGIVSSNSAENIHSWLKHHQMNHYFHFIHAGSSFFGKKRTLKKVLKQNNIERAFYIGDETRDIDAAHHSNIYSMAVTWGFNSENILSQYNPHCIAHTPQDILTHCLHYKNHQMIKN